MKRLPNFDNYLSSLKKTSGNSPEAYEAIISRVSAEDFMSEVVYRLAGSPGRIPEDVRRIPGIGLWPIPLYFPLILARGLFLLEQSVGNLRADRQWDRARKLAEVRQMFVHLSCGQEMIDGEQMSDLSGDHCEIFLKDHPEIRKLPAGTEERLPWNSFCQALLRETDALKLLGAISDNEDGSEAEQYALAATGTIKEGRFFSLHTVAEGEHAKISGEIERIISSEPQWHLPYLQGKVRHRILYAGVAGI